MNEQWKPVVGFEDAYSVSNLGQVKSLQRTKQNGSKNQEVPERILVQAKTNYPSVSLWSNGTLTVKKVHRIVAEAWIPNPMNKREVNHIDANRFNNSVENLEWVTREENVRHAIDNGLRARKSKVDKQEVCIFAKSNSHLTQRQIANKFNVSQSLVSLILRGTNEN